MWATLNLELIRQRGRNLARCLLLLPSLAGLVSGSASAQTPVPMYEGADRTQRLVEGANRGDEAALVKFKPVFVDAARVLDSYELWAKTYDDVLNGRPAAR